MYINKPRYLHPFKMPTIFNNIVPILNLINLGIKYGICLKYYFFIIRQMLE